MGNYRFRLSDMMPNAWFYKLKKMSKSRNQKTIRPTRKKQHLTSSSSSASSSSSSSASSSSSSANIAAPGPSSKPVGPLQQSHLSSQRKSYYFTRDPSTPPPANDHDHTFYNDQVTRSSPPRKSSREKRTTTRRNRATSSSNYTTSPGPWPVRPSVVSVECSCRANIPSVWTTEPDSTAAEEYQNPLSDSPSSDDQPLAVVPEFCSSRGTLAETTVQGMVSGSASCRCDSVQNRALLNQPELVKSVSEPYSVPKLGGFGGKVSEILDLPPIITNKPPGSKISKEREEGNYEPSCRLRRSEYRSLPVKAVEDDILSSSSNNAHSFKGHKKTSNTTCPAPPVATVSVRSSPPGAGGLKLRTNSPRIANMRIQFQARKSLSSSSSSSSRSRSRRRRSVSESFAVVKSSKDPESEFRESMMEMIVENNICASKDLEDLLACYLSLNSDQYHELIIRVFKQIWFENVDLDHPN